MQEGKDRQHSNTHEKKKTSIKTRPVDIHRRNETRVETIKTGQRNEKGWRQQSGTRNHTE